MPEISPLVSKNTQEVPLYGTTTTVMPPSGTKGDEESNSENRNRVALLLTVLGIVIVVVSVLAAVTVKFLPHQRVENTPSRGTSFYLADIEQQQPTVDLVKLEFRRGDRQRFIDNDKKIWTSFLEKQPGFVSKVNFIPSNATLAETTIWQMTRWHSFTQWKSSTSLKERDQARQKELDAAMGGYTPTLTPIPADGNGLFATTHTGKPYSSDAIVNTVGDEGDMPAKGTNHEQQLHGGGKGSAATDTPGVELDLVNCRPGDRERLMKNDYDTFTRYLSKRPGFGDKFYLVPTNRTIADTSVFIIIYWTSRALWRTVTPLDEAPIQQDFEERMGYTPGLVSVPQGGFWGGFKSQDYTV